MCGLGAIASPIASKSGRAAMLGGLAGAMLKTKGAKRDPQGQPSPQNADLA